MPETPDDVLLVFRVGDVFPADDPLAVWAMTLAIALGDLRVAGEHAVRDEQPDYERIYFVRVFSSHLREIVKLLDLDYEKREDVREFVDSMPEEAQAARRAVAEQFNAPQEDRPGVTLLNDLIRIRNDTFHYAHKKDSIERLTETLRRVADLESDIDCKPNEMRAACADLVVANRMHLFAEEEEDENVPLAVAMHQSIVALLDPVAHFLLHVEGHYVGPFLEDGTVRIERR